MEKKYSAPLAEVLIIDASESLMLPASPNGSTDEALSRQPYLSRRRGRPLPPDYLEDEWEDEEEYF